MRAALSRYEAGLIASQIALLVIFRPPAWGVDPPVEVRGGGPRTTDCYATFLANATKPAANPRRVVCVDGDATCDDDGAINGVCRFQVAVCANSTGEPKCTSPGVDDIFVVHSDDDGVDPDFHPDLQALQAAIDAAITFPEANSDVCSATASISVRVTGPISKNRCRRARKLVRLIATPSDGGREDKDLLRLQCLPAPEELNGCDPQTFFTSTFDRIQRQILNESCATATCHDSESGAAGLLLESGSSYSNLVGAPPTNGDALGLGWDRITAGDSTNSFLYYKINNDLGAAPNLGKRMPRPPRRRMLHKSLREIIQLWIDAGAPVNGWVPGTF